MGDVSPTEMLQTLYEAHSNDIYRYARLSLGNHADAMDVVQEVFLRAHQAMDKYRAQSSPRTWLFAIARNLMIDLSRKRRTEQNYLRDAMHTETFVHRDPSESIAELMSLESLLFKIKDTYRDVIVLRHIEDLSVEETAKVLGWKPAKVRTVDHRATKRLRLLAASSTEEVERHG